MKPTFIIRCKLQNAEGFVYLKQDGSWVKNIKEAFHFVQQKEANICMRMHRAAGDDSCEVVESVRSVFVVISDLDYKDKRSVKLFLIKERIDYMCMYQQLLIRTYTEVEKELYVEELRKRFTEMGIVCDVF